MRKIILLAVATIGSSFIAASPSLAQPQIQFGIGPDGRPQVGVRDPEQERYERRERRRDERARAYEAGRRDALRDERRYGYESRCRNITIQEENEWGRTVTRRVRRCD